MAGTCSIATQFRNVHLILWRNFKFVYLVSDLVIEVAMHQLDLGSNHLLLSYKYLPKNTFEIVFIYVMSSVGYIYISTVLNCSST